MTHRRPVYRPVGKIQLVKSNFILFRERKFTPRIQSSEEIISVC